MGLAGPGSVFIGQFSGQNNAVAASNVIAIGTNALQNGNQSADIIAIGTNALQENTSGNFNIAIGTNALEENTTGSNNTAMGYTALALNRTGFSNTAVGYRSLYENVTGNRNSAFGAFALEINTGTNNTAVGNAALADNTAGIENTGVGTLALQNNSTGSFNTAVGRNALGAGGDGDNNVGVGHTASIVGSENVVVGAASGQDGSRNVVLGFSSFSGGLSVNNDNNVAIGYQSMNNNSLSGDNNTAVGYRSLKFVQGNTNIAIGSDAGSLLTTGSNNIYIGNVGGVESGIIRIGTLNTHTANFQQGIANNAIAGAQVSIDVVTGQLGIIPSSIRYKENVKDLDSSSILNLRPVTFNYKADIAQKPQYGLIAEEVHKIMPELVLYNGNHEDLYQQHYLSKPNINLIKNP